MDNNGNDGPDSFSTRPVSSLRSHFERISSPNPTVHTVSTAPFSGETLRNTTHSQQQGSARSSTDLPRRPKGRDNFTLHPAELGGSQLQIQRDGIDISEPAFQPSPIGNAGEQPNSTHKAPMIRAPLNISGTSILRSEALPARPLKTQHDREVFSNEGAAVGSPSKVVSEPGHAYVKPTLDKAGNVREATLQSRAGLGFGYPASHHRVLPPPVNRAEKPKVLLSPAAIDRGDSLRPASPFVDEKVSPFSTPPSSDESLGSYRSSNGVVNSRVQPPPRRSEDRTDRNNVTSASMTSSDSRPPPVGDPRTLGSCQRNTAPAGGKPALPTRWVPGSVEEMPSDQKMSLRSDRSSPPALSHDKTPWRTDRSTAMPPPPKPPSSFIGSQVNAPEPTAPRVVSTHEAGSAHHAEADVRPKASLKGMSLFPDIAMANRRLPHCQAGARSIAVDEDTKLMDICGTHVCTAGQAVRIWNVMTGEMLFCIAQAEREVKTSAVAFKPAVTSNEEGSRIWIGTNSGDLQELDIPSQTIVDTRGGAHERREIVKIHRHQNAMWTIDDGGKLCIWSGDTSGLPNLRSRPESYRVNKGHTCSLIVQDCLWMATGKEINILRPKIGDPISLNVLEKPLCQPDLGTVTSATVISSQMDRVYFGHADGKVSVYSATEHACLSIVAINAYKINSLLGAGSFLWAAFSIGTLCVYDTTTWPWKTKKSWLGHQGHATLGLAIDRSSLWKSGTLRLMSFGADGFLRFWDGIMKNDWFDDFMRENEVEFCSFREISALLVSWNAGATTPGHMRNETSNQRFFLNIVENMGRPDMLVFGFQELVDLEDKKLTAKSLFKGNKKKDTADYEHMSHQYRAWRDYLIKTAEEASSSSDPYQLLHTANMVGLFSCIFIKASQRARLRVISAGEVKRGMGGLHGNKGALIVRFILDDSSICFVNCHLAAGQTQTSNRNNDITAILESETLQAGGGRSGQGTSFVCGGDGSMILDHETCIVSGDLNYRIDTMGRDTVLKALSTDNLAKLLERDQLLVSQRRYPALPLRALREAQITFPPTYKYNIGSDTYDTSEKRRAPAWCDRILSRGAGTIQQIDYRRHELRISDHRPVSALFRIRVKSILHGEQASTWARGEEEFGRVKERLSMGAKMQYLRDVLGVPLDEAQLLV